MSKADADAPGSILPNDFAGKPNHGVISRQRELKIHLAMVWQPALRLDREALFTQVQQGGGGILGAGIVNRNLRVQGNAWLTPLFAPHQASCRVQTIPGPFRRNRSEEHTSELQSQSNLVCRL